MSNIANEICNPSSLRQKGIAALTAALGPVGMAQFFRQFEQGRGDYTAERETLLANVTLEDFETFVQRNREQSEK
jgi:hypothetical protein